MTASLPPDVTRRRPGPPPGTGRQPIRHGTDGGYTAHLRHDVPVCDACRQAHNAKERRLRAIRRRNRRVPA